MRAAAGSAAASAGRTEVVSLGCRLRAAGCRPQVAIWWPGGPTWSAAGGYGAMTRRVGSRTPRTPGHQPPVRGSPEHGSHHERDSGTGPPPAPSQACRKPAEGSGTPPIRSGLQGSGPDRASQTPPVGVHRATHQPPPRRNTCCLSSMTMPYMTEMCTDLLGSPNTHPISIHRPPRHHQDAPEEQSQQGPRATGMQETPRTARFTPTRPPGNTTTSRTH